MAIGRSAVLAACICGLIAVVAGYAPTAEASSSFRHSGHAQRHAAHPHKMHRTLTYREKRGSWQCNPWYGSSRLEGPLFTLGKGYWRGYCLEHQTNVASDYRRWQYHENAWRYGHRVRYHSNHDWLRNADLRYRVR